MNSFEEYLKEYIREQKRLMCRTPLNENEFGYYTGRQDAGKDILQEYWRGKREKVDINLPLAEELISKLKSIRYYARRLPGKYLGGECVGLCNRVRSLKSSVSDLEETLKSLGYLDSDSICEGAENVRHDAMRGYYMSKYYSIYFSTVHFLNGTNSLNKEKDYEIFVKELSEIIERLEDGDGVKNGQILQGHCSSIDRNNGGGGECRGCKSQSGRRVDES